MAVGDVYSPKVRESALARKFISQDSGGYVALGIYNGQAPVDADTDTIGIKLFFNDASPGVTPPGVLLFSADPGSELIVRDDVGKYHFAITPAFTANRGFLTVMWTYVVDGVDFSFTDNLQVLEHMPLWERLSEDEKGIVESVSWMFADSFDSTEGGPYLFETYQSHYNYERIAQLTRVAMYRINTTGNPPTEFEIGGEPGKYSPIPAFMKGTLVIGAYIEVLRHLVRNYTEIPMFQGANITYADRRDYQQRWQQVLQDEERNYKSMVIQAKRKLLGLGSTSILVGGGPWFGGASGFVPGMWAAQVRGSRFYPAAPALYGQLARTR